jgi:gamma-glutamyltranspeptidase/glutathione hydrolase
MRGIRQPIRLRFVRLAIVLVAITISVPGAVRAQSGRQAAPARHGMVVSAHYLASEVGRDVLLRGGNAIDAVVATALAAAVVYPSAGNLGGGGFIVYHGADGRITSFNFREKAPLAATRDMYVGEDGQIRRTDRYWESAGGRLEDESNHFGLLAVGVPGTVAGLYLAHQRLGSLPWAELVEPAIRLAEDGFPSSWSMQAIQKAIQRNAERYPSTAQAFLNEGRPYEPGEIWKEQLPIHGTYRGFDIYSMAPPSSGGTVLVEMLNILEAYPLARLGHNSARYLHVLAEAMRRAYADRARFLGDPAFSADMPVDRLTSKQYAELLRAGIDDHAASSSDSAGFNSVFESEETTHISAVDSLGNAVSLTYTLEYSYGSRIVVEGAGFLLNNEMGDFNAIPGLTDSKGNIGTEPNVVAPAKHMLSSMTPTIVARNGEPELVVGTPGGRTIINTVLQVILNILDHELDLGQAVEAPRIHHQWLPDALFYENFGFSPDTIDLLEEMGHKVRARGDQGSVSAIKFDRAKGVLFGAADSRGFDARAAGF